MHVNLGELTISDLLCVILSFFFFLALLAILNNSSI